MKELSTLVCYLALMRAPGVGAVTLFKFIEAFPELQNLFNLSRHELKDYGFKEPLIEYLRNPDWAAVERDIFWQDQPQQHIIIYSDECYPQLLREIHAPPPVIYVKGQSAVLQTPQLAIVGARHPTRMGSETAYQFAEHLSSEGLTITSGLALGIDAIGHRGALVANGLTIAVLGSGLENIYPSRHRALAEKILAQGGAIISEFPPEATAAPENFPQRNRIISGLSLGVLIVEAALQSGSLITAKYALEQGREIFAIPGSIHNPLAKGCHYLIKQGAKLVETSADILDELIVQCPIVSSLKKINNHPSPIDLTALDAHYRKLVECIDFVSTPMDVIIHRSGLTAETVSSMLLMMELQGYIQAVNGGYARLQPVYSM